MQLSQIKTSRHSCSPVSFGFKLSAQICSLFPCFRFRNSSSLNPTFPFSFLRTLYCSHSTFNSNHVDDVASSFHRLLRLNPTPSIIEFNKILGSLVKLKHYPTVISISYQLEFNGIRPDIVSLGILINCYCHVGQMIFAFSIFTLCKNHHVDKAIVLVKKIKDQGIQLDMYTYNILIDGLCKQGRLKDVRVIIQDLLIKGYNLTVWTYTIMINGICFEGLLDEAEALLSKMEDNGCVPDAVTCETIIRALFENDKNERAEKLLREMISRGLL